MTYTSHMIPLLFWLFIITIASFVRSSASAASSTTSTTTVSISTTSNPTITTITKTGTSTIHPLVTFLPLNQRSSLLERLEKGNHYRTAPPPSSFRTSLSSSSSSSSSHNNHQHCSSIPSTAPTASSVSSSSSSASMTMFPFPNLPISRIREHLRHINIDRSSWSLCKTTTTASTTNTSTSTNTIRKIRIHCIVLIHGWMGNSKELSYLQSQLIQQGDRITEATMPHKNNQCNNTHNTNNNNNNDQSKNNNDTTLTYFITYSSIINEPRTSDGIAKGGQRLAYEINTFLQHIRQQILQFKDKPDDDDITTSSHDDKNRTSTANASKDHHHYITTSTNIQWDISLSTIGNSLGGLYARYALRDIQFQYPHHHHPNGNSVDSTKTSNFVGVHKLSSKIHPAVFVTTCTPHLGVGMDRSYVQPYQIPFGIQRIMAHIIGPTGQDLFRIPIADNTTTTTTTITQNKTTTTATITTTTTHPTRDESQSFTSNPTSLSSSSTSSTTTKTTWPTNTDDSIVTTNGTHTSYSHDILQEMTFRSEFLRPLQNFHRRIALCNTYRTDLQVPCSTAAFLISPISLDSSFISNRNTTIESSFNHHNHNTSYYRSSDWNDKVVNTGCVTNPNSCISLIVETTASTTCFTTNNKNHQAYPVSSNEMAHQLDTLGWMKIFCDTRPYLPYIPIPTILINYVRVISAFIEYAYHITVLQMPFRLLSSTKVTSTTLDQKTNDSIIITKDHTAIPTSITYTTTTSIHPTTQDDISTGNYSTRDIWARYVEDDGNDDGHHDQVRSDPTRNNRRNWFQRFYIPLGHTIVVANAKNEWYGQMNAKGRPTMDALAQIIIQEIVQSQ